MLIFRSRSVSALWLQLSTFSFTSHSHAGAVNQEKTKLAEQGIATRNICTDGVPYHSAQLMSVFDAIAVALRAEFTGSVERPLHWLPSFVSSSARIDAEYFARAATAQVDLVSALAQIPFLHARIVEINTSPVLKRHILAELESAEISLHIF